MTPVEASHFGTIELDDGGLFLADGGVHGVSGHTILVDRDGTLRWQRRVDSFRPAGPEGHGRLVLDPEERRLVAEWREAAWHHRKPPRPGSGPPQDPVVPRWVWAVAVCRDGTTRLIEGGGTTYDAAPDDLAGLLRWLRERVDELASG